MKPKFAGAQYYRFIAGYDAAEVRAYVIRTVFACGSRAARCGVANSSLAWQLPTRQRQRFVDRLRLHIRLCVRLLAVAGARSLGINLLFVRHSNSLSLSIHRLPLMTGRHAFSEWDLGGLRKTLAPSANRTRNP